MQVWDYATEDDLKELISTTYTNKMHLFFSSSSLRNFIIKRVWLRVVMEWVTFWDISGKHVNEGKTH